MRKPVTSRRGKCIVIPGRGGVRELERTSPWPSSMSTDLVSSLTTKSINRRLATALVKLAPPELTLREFPLRDLPLHSYDYDSDYPEAATRFKGAIAKVDAVLFVTPEDNRSIPGALKNAIDWASRPYGQNAFTRKPSAVIGLSRRDRDRGRTTAPAQRARLLQLAADERAGGLHPVQALPHRRDGQVTNESTAEFLRTFMAEFHIFIERVLTVLPRQG